MPGLKGQGVVAGSLLLLGGCFGSRSETSVDLPVERVARVRDRLLRAARDSNCPASAEDVVRLLKSSGDSWLQDLRTTLFYAEADAELRFWSALFLAHVRDRQSFEHILAKLPDPTFRIPTPAAIEILGRVSKREDVPALIEHLKTPRAWAKLCCCWALFYVTGNYLGSPDEGGLDREYYSRWSEWWRVHGSETKTEWYRSGMLMCLYWLRFGSPAYRAAVAQRAMALASTVDAYGVDLLAADTESWERWWHEKGSKATVQEEQNPGGGAHYHTWQRIAFWEADPFWGAEEDKLEWMKLEHLKAVVESLREPRVVRAGQIQLLEMLTDIHFDFPPLHPLELRDLTPSVEAWERWYGENADRLRWDWGKGNLVVADGH